MRTLPVNIKGPNDKSEIAINEHPLAVYGDLPLQFHWPEKGAQGLEACHPSSAAKANTDVPQTSASTGKELLVSKPASLTASLPDSVYLLLPPETTFLDRDSHGRSASGHRNQKGRQGHVHNHTDSTSQVPHAHSIAQSIPSPEGISGSRQDEKLHRQRGSFPERAYNAFRSWGEGENGGVGRAPGGAGREVLTLAMLLLISTSDVILQACHTGHELLLEHRMPKTSRAQALKTSGPSEGPLRKGPLARISPFLGPGQEERILPWHELLRALQSWVLVWSIQWYLSTRH